MANTKRPNAGVLNITTPERTGAKLKAKWKLAKSARSGDYAYAAQRVTVLLNGLNTKKGKKTVKNDRTITKPAANNATELEVAFARGQWYPFSGKPKLGSVTFSVVGTNSKGAGPKRTSPALKLALPAKPTVTLTANIERGEVTATSKSPVVNGAAERYDQILVVSRSDNFSGKKNRELYRSGFKKGATLSKTLDISDSKTLSNNQVIKISARAYARGLRGNSAVAEAVHVFAWPATPEITGVSCANSASKAGMVIIKVSTHNSQTHPIDTVQLQRLRSSSATTAAAAALVDGWQDVDGATDDGQCTGLTDQLADAYPLTDGTRTWYRLKAVHDDYTVYGEPYQLPVYNAPNAGSVSVGAVTIIGVDSGADGTSVDVRLGWNGASGNGTEVTYSTRERAWWSTTAPEEKKVDWEDDESADENYEHTATVTLYDREIGTPLYIRARRYTTGDSTVYGPYGNTATIVPVAAPGPVVLSAPANAERGSDVTVSWSHAGGSPQTMWFLHDSISGKGWGGGGTAGAYTIPAAAIGDAEALTLTASVTTDYGNDWTESDPRTIAIVERPSCAVTIPQTITKQPLQVTVETDATSPQLALKVTSEGIAGETPIGDFIQARGDVILALDEDNTEWAETETGKVAVVTLPVSSDILDGCTYVVGATVTDAATGLVSDLATATGTVAWEHQADEPSAAIVADTETMSAAITLVAPEGYRSGDVCDLYRLTARGAMLIASGLAFGTVVTDPWAPFASIWVDSNLAYRVATRTPDSDIAWADVPYSLVGESTIIDFRGEQIDLPYNQADELSMEKTFEPRAHPFSPSFDSGGMRPEGFWGRGVTQDGTIPVTLTPTHDYARRALLLQLGGYPGGAFVRLPSGEAYQANVTLGSLRMSYDGTPVSGSLTTREVALTDEYRPSLLLGQIVAPTWRGGALSIINGEVYDATGGFPLDAWSWIGWSDALAQGYVADDANAVRTLDGTAMDGWAFDGETLTDSAGDAVEVVQEVPDGD